LTATAPDWPSGASLISTRRLCRADNSTPIAEEL
jgi:hypothetical protein